MVNVLICYTSLNADPCRFLLVMDLVYPVWALDMLRRKRRHQLQNAYPSIIFKANMVKYVSIPLPDLPSKDSLR